MLDKRTTEMLEVANQLSEEDLDYLRGACEAVAVGVVDLAEEADSTGPLDGSVGADARLDGVSAASEDDDAIDLSLESDDDLSQAASQANATAGPSRAAGAGGQQASTTSGTSSVASTGGRQHGSGTSRPQASSQPQADCAAAASIGSQGQDPSRGERERQRTRESKIATECVGQQRPKHEWWPVGTQLQGRIMGEVFTALVVENSQVKSGRSLLITSGPANGKVCITPTRAALEATEAYRQANNLGRGGGVTNGWEFWEPVAS